jgi:xylan 1,4-beta-xylosidase
VTHVPPRAVYRFQVHRTGYHANDAYSAYLEMGSPKDLTAEQVEHLNHLTPDAAEIDRTVRSSPKGTLTVEIPMSSNDIVLLELSRVGSPVPREARTP